MCGRESPSGENFAMLAFTDHLHAHKAIEHYRRGKPPKSIIGPFHCIAFLAVTLIIIYTNRCLVFSPYLYLLWFFIPCGWKEIFDINGHEYDISLTALCAAFWAVGGI